jgi:hypothetical protein
MKQPSPLPRAVWSGVPTIGIADICHKRFRESLKTELASLLSTVERTFSAPAGALSSSIQSIDPTRRYNPALYTVHWRLAKELQDANVNGVVEVLELLDELLPNPYAPDGISISQLDNSIPDASVLEFLLGPEGARGPDGEVPEMNQLSDEQFRTTTEYLQQALSLISSLDLGISDELLNYVATIKPFTGRVVRGMTSVRTFGIIYIRLPDGVPSIDEILLYFVDHLTHEVSHLHLHTLMNVDPLLTNPDSERFSAPIRKDLRPLYGIYHATFVLSRIVRTLGRLKAVNNSSTVSLAFDEAVGRYRKGYETVAKHGTLTPLGRQLFEATRQVAELD